MQKKVHEQLDAEFGQVPHVFTTEDRARLPYVEATTMEVLRCYPVAPFALIHVAACDTKIASYHLPKGTQVSQHFQ